MEIFIVVISIIVLYVLYRLYLVINKFFSALDKVAESTNEKMTDIRIKQELKSARLRARLKKELEELDHPIISHEEFDKLLASKMKANKKDTGD